MGLLGVVIMDVVDSRKRKNRAELQSILQNSIEQFNNKYQHLLIAPTTITLGDEWQVVLKDPSQCYNVVHFFQKALWLDEINIHAGFGMGTLSTAESKDIRQMDGSCFHSARQAMTILKGTQRRKILGSRHNRVYFHSDKEILFLGEAAVTTELLGSEQEVAIQDLINTLIQNNEILKARMTLKQRKVYIDYLKYGSYRKVIEFSDERSLGNISEKLNAAEFTTIQRNHELVEALLRYYSLLRR